MKIVLQVANERRVSTEEGLDCLLSYPILSARLSTSNEAIRKEHKELSEMLQAKERQLGMLTKVFLQKEQDLQKLKDTQRQMILKGHTFIEPIQEEQRLEPMEFLLTIATVQNQKRPNQVSSKHQTSVLS